MEFLEKSCLVVIINSLSRRVTADSDNIVNITFYLLVPVFNEELSPLYYMIESIEFVL